MQQKKDKRTGGLKAVILDMDGVITQTAKTHKAAWKEMFNEFLKKQSNEYQLMTDKDYVDYIDGKPRYNGVESFLKSRNIQLPFGDPEDSPGKKTVCGLGNRKNEIYTSLLKENGAETYGDAIEKIKFWRNQGLKTAVVSSSKNCKFVLETAGITHLFDIRIDGITAKERKLKGKPNPDIFLEATKELGVSSSNCALFEDAISGVQAGSNGNFALVVGVGRNKNKKALSENGADIVIEDFRELDLLDDKEIQWYFSEPAPAFLSEYDKIIEIIGDKNPVLFLDYDGTLTPIVKRPEDALISFEMREVLRECAEKFTVAVVSGRDMDDLKNKVGVDSLIYAGSHGFRISGPDGLYKEHDKPEEILQKLNHIEKILQEVIFPFYEGVQIDRKRYAIGVHYRNAKEEDIPEIIQKVNEIIDNNPGFKKGEGKKILEIKPDVDWHKGKAVLWILKKLGLQDKNKNIPIYIGDDITDEDAYKTIKGFGIGIQVGPHGQTTAAKYKLKNVYQVRIFLKKLAKVMA
jgi:trehalose 6-phosphate phosphatase